MVKKQEIQVFDERKVRTVWDDEREEWYFSVVDVVEVLADSANPKQYIKKMRKRDPELDARWGTICTLTQLVASDGKRYRSTVATCEGLFRIIQSIPSPKAEPFKQWMAQVAARRIDQMQDPELSINQAVDDYKRLGRSDEWIKRRLKGIEIRKGLTDEWKRGGIQPGKQYATLTDILTKAWSDRTTKEYKHLKGLKKENLRDNMSDLELIFNSLAEASATALSKNENPKGIVENAKVARRGGDVAKTARKQLESQLGHTIITSKNAKDFTALDEPDEAKRLE